MHTQLLCSTPCSEKFYLIDHFFCRPDSGQLQHAAHLLPHGVVLLLSQNYAGMRFMVVQEENDIEELVWNQYLERSFLPERGSGYDANTSYRGPV